MAAASVVHDSGDAAVSCCGIVNAVPAIRPTAAVEAPSQATLRRRVEGAAVARLATVGADGHPHLVPICFALAGDVLYSAVDRKPKRSANLKRLENVRANPRVTVLVDHYDDDWTQLWWVRLDGDARVLTERLEQERALELLKAKYPQYLAETPTGPVLAIAIERWHGWEHGASRP